MPPAKPLPYLFRRRDSSLSGVGSSSSRNSVLITSSGLGSETARYNREIAMKEISSNFNRQFEESTRKYHPHSSGGSSGGEEEKLTRARAKIIGLSYTPSPMDEKQARKDCLR